MGRRDTWSSHCLSVTRLLCIRGQRMEGGTGEGALLIMCNVRDPDTGYCHPIRGCINTFWTNRETFQCNMLTQQGHVSVGILVRMSLVVKQRQSNHVRFTFHELFYSEQTLGEYCNAIRCTDLTQDLHESLLDILLQNEEC